MKGAGRYHGPLNTVKAVALSGQTTISQDESGRKPEEHQASQSQEGEATLEGESLELVSETSNYDGGYIYRTFTRPRSK